MRCAIYARLSKEDEEKQQPESESIQNQKALLTGYAAEQGWEVYRIYCDEDYSGADSLRPDFNRMVEAARAGKFQVILCKSQSRFTRDMELVEKYIHGLFPLWGVRFIAVADHTDTEIRGNKKARQINGLINQWYLEDLSENIRMVFDMKRRQGQYIGGFPIYGYRKDPCDKHHLLIDPEAAEVVRQIFRWALEGWGKQRIAAALNDRGAANPTQYKAERGLACNHLPSDGSGLWSKNTVWRILHNEMYTGVMVQGRTRKVSYKSKAVRPVPEDQWFRVEGAHQAIIDRETFDQVQQLTRLRTRTDGAGEVHVLSGLVKCMDCGSTMSKTSNGRRGAKQVQYLRCKRYADSGKEKLCTRHSIRLDALIQLVTEQVRRYVQTYYHWEETQFPPQRDFQGEALLQEKRRLASQLEKRRRALESLYLDKVSGILTQAQFTALNQSFLQEADRLEGRLAQLDAALAQAPPQPDRRERAQALLRLDTLPRELAVAMIQKIEIGEQDPDTGQQEIKIHWNF